MYAKQSQELAPITAKPTPNLGVTLGQDDPPFGLPHNPDQQAGEAVCSGPHCTSGDDEGCLLARVVPTEHAQCKQRLTVIAG